MKLVLATFLFVSLVFSSSLLHFTTAQPLTAGPPPAVPPTAKSFCDVKCDRRCAKAEMHERCMTYCGICCRQCKCVPSGTYGNKSECPCYRDKLNSKGKPKCP